jgi:hypothetical protein
MIKAKTKNMSSSARHRRYFGPITRRRYHMDNPYNAALMSEEGTRLRGAVHAAIDDYVLYFESCGLQIEQSWVTELQMDASFPYCGLKKEATIDPEYEAVVSAKSAA